MTLLALLLALYFVCSAVTVSLIVILLYIIVTGPAPPK